MLSARLISGTESKVFPLYDQDGIEVRPSLISDSFELKQEDCNEVWWSHRFYPEDAIYISIKSAFKSFTVLIDGRPEIIFGINPISLVGNDAIIWMLSSERINDIGRRFAKHTRRYINYFLSLYSNLYNFVIVENHTSIKWLKINGAKFEKPIPYGISGKPFMRFSFS